MMTNYTRSPAFVALTLAFFFGGPYDDEFIRTRTSHYGVIALKLKMMNNTARHDGSTYDDEGEAIQMDNPI